MEEKKEKKLHEKWWFIIIAIIFVFVIAPFVNGDKSDDNKIETVSNDENKAKETENNSNQEVEEVDSMIELDDELLFAEFKINMKSVEFYEEDGKDLVEVKYSWANQSGDGKKYFFALTTHDALQGDEVLMEITGAANMENKKTNSYHEHNGEGGTVNIRLVYELLNKETPVTLRFKPLNEFGEEAQEIIIDIN